MTKHRTVRDAWNDYREKVLPFTAPPIQIRECRRSFYAGAEMLMCEILNGLDPSPGATQSDIDYIATLHEELLRFARDVERGMA
jgi:hypothetical protein